jgi:hypothetical protein
VRVFQIIILSFLIFSSINCNRKSDENAILLADREAPLGWMYLKVYNDNTFEYISKGFIFDDTYPGTVRISHDTLYFKYSTEVPKYFGKTAVANKIYVEYLDSSEFIEIKLNKLKN